MKIKWWFNWLYICNSILVVPSCIFFTCYRDRYSVPMPNQPGYLIGISSQLWLGGFATSLRSNVFSVPPLHCRNAASEAFFLGLGHILIVQTSFRLLSYGPDPLQAPYSLWRKSLSCGRDCCSSTVAWARMINLEVSEFLVFHFMLDGSDNRGLAQLNFFSALAKRRENISETIFNLDGLSFLIWSKIHCTLENANACPLLEE